MSSDEMLEPFRLPRETLRRLDINGLPGIPLAGIEYGRDLPVATSAVYFLTSQAAGLLYIGRATNLRTRWRVERHILDTSRIDWERCHDKLRDALDKGDVVLRWWAIPREYLAAAESLLLQIHRPPWNNHRG